MLALVQRKVIIYSGISALLMFSTSLSFAQLPVRNHNPLALSVGLPSLKSASKLSDGRSEFGIDTTISSHFISEVNADEKDSLHFDGETYVTDFIWTHGFQNFEVEVILPHISYEEGFLDDFIIDWHNTFNFPGGGREDVENDQLLFFYEGKDSELLDKPSSGLGDVRLVFGKQITSSVNYQHAIHALIKLPTGDHKKWLGSGGTDISFFTTHSWRAGEWSRQLQVGAIYMQEPDFLKSQRKDLAAFLNMALNWHLNEQWKLIAQLDTHSSLYEESNQEALGYGQMISGGIERQGKAFDWYLSMVEDIRVDSAPDVGYQFGFRFKH